MMDFETYVDDQLNERIVRKAVIRNRKKVYKWIDTRPGYRIQHDGNGNRKSVRMKFKEKLKRRLAQTLHGQKKRNAKEKKIQHNRKLAFKLRKSAGLAHYDKKNPAKRTKDGVLFKVIKKLAKSTDKLLHPAHESFTDYVNRHHMLNESPHAFILDNDRFELCWDFYSEIVGMDWFNQLITLYRDHHIDSAVKGGNATMDTDEIIESIDFDDNEMEEITDNLIDSVEFKLIAKKDLLDCDPELRAEVERYLPARLLKAIMEMKVKNKN